MGGAALFPSTGPEPFGLVMIEAMACSTPVIALSPMSTVLEVIDEGVTGFVVDSEEEAVRAVRRLGEIDRRQVRACFERRFTARRMARPSMLHSTKVGCGAAPTHNRGDAGGIGDIERGKPGVGRNCHRADRHFSAGQVGAGPRPRHQAYHPGATAEIEIVDRHVAALVEAIEPEAGFPSTVPRRAPGSRRAPAGTISSAPDARYWPARRCRRAHGAR